MKGITVFIFLCLCLYSGITLAQQNSKDIMQVKAILETQTKAWNEGSLEKFMQGYWQSDSLTFIGSKGVTQGWNNTLLRYQKSYGNKDLMGKLKFTLLSIQKLSPKYIFIIGKWQLQRTTDNLEGHFTLLWKKIKKKWVIVSDHSS